MAVGHRATRDERSVRQDVLRGDDAPRIAVADLADTERLGRGHCISGQRQGVIAAPLRHVSQTLRARTRYASAARAASTDGIDDDSTFAAAAAAAAFITIVAISKCIVARSAARSD